MKNILRYILALPVGVLASFIFLNLYEFALKYILNFFLYFDFMRNLAYYLCLGYSSYLFVLIPSLVAPRFKKTFLFLALLLSLFGIVYNFLFLNESIIISISHLVGTIIALYIGIKNNEVDKVTETTELVEEYDPTEDLEFLDSLEIEEDLKKKHE